MKLTKNTLGSKIKEVKFNLQNFGADTIYVIHDIKKPQRRIDFEHAWSHFSGFKYEYIDAVTPDDFNLKELIENESVGEFSLGKEFYDTVDLCLTKNILAIAFSHFRAYRACNTLENGDRFLILEDDVFPKNEYLDNSKQFYNDLNNEIENIKIIDKNWDIIQLHSDGLIDTKSTYTTHLFTGSTAAYLISFNGLKKMCNEKVTYHIDFVTQNFLKYRKYRSRTNLFYTNEKSSVNREMNYSKSTILKSALLQKIIPLRGEKIWEDYLSFKSLRIPIINKEFTVNNLFDFGLLFSLFYALKNKKILELTN